MSSAFDGSVLILGGGVNGVCLARELAINGVPLVLVDEADLASGASAKSSRLIHGGLRYLEYAEFSLVQESLDERRRLLELAPQFVTPLRLHIPIRARLGGLAQGAARFLKLNRFAPAQWLADTLTLSPQRGLYAVRTGLKMYDQLAGDQNLPRSTVNRVGDPGTPPVNPAEYQWLCSYWDAQILSTERFVLALLRDARDVAAQAGSLFEIRTYHKAHLEGEGVVIRSVLDSPDTASSDAASSTTAEPLAFRPSMIVNATGAWGDWTLQELPVAAPKLFGGTRGSHILTRNALLKQAIGEEAIYAEARDGRLVFILPWDDAVMIGTTDERFTERPDRAVALPSEVSYLVHMVNEVFPHVGLTEGDVISHYSGVRPLPAVPVGKTAAISRDHEIDSRTTTNNIPIDTLVGGKLTTCRSLGEIVADRVFKQLGLSRTADTRERPVPGAERFPIDKGERALRIADTATSMGLSVESMAAAWTLLGTEALSVLSADEPEGAVGDITTTLTGTVIPLRVIDWMIRHEWVTGVPDLVERRLMLPFRGRVSRATLEHLEERLRIIRGACVQNARHAAERLQTYYGVSVST